jgi:hypothetical protein
MSAFPPPSHFRFQLSTFPFQLLPIRPIIARLFVMGGTSATLSVGHLASPPGQPSSSLVSPYRLSAIGYLDPAESLTISARGTTVELTTLFAGPDKLRNAVDRLQTLLYAA